MIRTKIVAVPKGSATSVITSRSNSGSSSISPGTNGSSSSDGSGNGNCLWQTGDGDSSIMSKGSDDLTSNMLEVAIGQYNNTTKDKTSFSVGNGSGTTNRSNAFEVQNDGTAIATTFQSGSVNTTTINSANINNSDDIVNGGNITNIGNFNNTGNITNTGTLKTGDTTVDNDLTVRNSITSKTINADVGNIKDIYSDNITNKNMIKTKDLTVTGTAHFFELVIDKIKAAGGAAIFTPADGFDVDVVEAVENGYKLYWRCEVDGKVRQNMWKVNDQAICMSFNQAKVGVSYNVSNKYYWSLVTAVSEYSKPVTLADGNKYNWITISTTTCDGTVSPEVSDSIAMLGYRGTDDEARQSAIYITAYASFDKGVEPPFIAQYKGIKDFDIEKYRTSWWSLKTNKFVGDFVIESSGKNVIDFVNGKVKDVDNKVDSSVTELNTTINEKYSSLSTTIDGINAKVVNNTTSITKLGTDLDATNKNLDATNKNLDETTKNLSTTNSNITALEKTVQENYSTLDQKADDINAKVVSNTDSITKLGTNLETTNSNITKLETSVNEKYAELDIKSDGISSKVADNTTKITTLGTDLDTTNSNITSLEKTVTENYSTLDQKADGISTKVSENTTTITKLGENLDTTNENVTSLEKTVTENYSKLDQKADSIQTTVSSHTKTIEGLDGRVTTNTENISKIKQTADSISSTVESLGDTYVSKSELSQTSDSILAQVNNNYIKIGDTNITIGGDTTIDGSLTLTDDDQGFKLIGTTGVTEIMPKSIGTYDEFKNTNTGVQAFIKNISAGGSQVTSGNTDVLTFKGSGIIKLGDKKKGDYVEVRIDSLSAKVTNSYDSSTSSWTRSYPISPTYTANVTKEDNNTVIKSFGTLKAGTTYSVNFTEDITDARVVVNFSGTTLMSSWKAGYSNPSGQSKPMPVPFANFHFDGVVNLPTNAHMLIGYDGWAVNFGNNKTVYCGSDGFIASFGDQTFKITSDGIYSNNKRNVKVLDGTGYSSDKPNTYTIVPPIDTVLCKGTNCKVIFPSNPEEGYMITIFDKCTDNCYINSNGKNAQGTTNYGTDMNPIVNQELNARIPWRFTFMNNCWYQEYIG